MVFGRWGELETGGIVGGAMGVHTIDKLFWGNGMEWTGRDKMKRTKMFI